MCCNNFTKQNARENTKLSQDHKRKVVIQRSLPKCAKTIKHSRIWETFSIHLLVKSQSSTKCSESQSFTVNLLSSHHPICDSQQCTICSPKQKLKQWILCPGFNITEGFKAILIFLSHYIVLKFKCDSGNHDCLKKNSGYKRWPEQVLV